MAQSTRKDIALSKLLVNSENPRFTPVQDQTEAVTIMVNNQKDKLLNLIKDILENGLDPSNLPIVTPNGNNYTVLEGNRRVTSLKLINSPDLIKNINNEVWTKLNRVLKSNNFNINDKITCVVFEEESDAYRWIELKHTGENSGRGTVSWDPASSKRFSLKASGKKSPAVQIIDFIKNSDAFNEEIKSNVDKVSLTNIERLVSDPIVRETIGLDLKDGIIRQSYPDEEVAKPLSKIVADLANKKIVVGDIYTKHNRTEYLSGFSEDTLPSPDKQLSEQTSLEKIPSSDSNLQLIENKPEALTINPELKGASSSKKGRGANFSYDRKYLIPTTFHIKIQNRHINDIFKELKRLVVTDFTNSTAVLFRVFLELSLDEYIDYKKVKEIDNNAKLNKKLQWCLDDLKTAKAINDHDAKPVNQAVSSPNSILSTNTFNSYVHNKDMYPNEKDLKIAWNNLEKFIKVLWESVQ